MAGALGDLIGKMGIGILRYSPHEVACVIDPAHAGEDLVRITNVDRPAPIVKTIRDAKELGADVLVLGIAPPGGQIPAEWYPVLDEAVADGMSLVNGLHDHLSSRYPDLPEGQWVWDMRQEPENVRSVEGTVCQMEARRLLMIGTDMSVGKMTAGLEIFKCARENGVKTEFVATGQIGMTITGRGVPVDAVRVDFSAAAVEREVLACAGADLIIIEGQGSFVHPGSSAGLPLIRGSCPTDMILCHRAGMTHLSKMPGIPIPPLKDLIRLNEDLAYVGGTFCRPVTRAIALDTSRLNEAEAADELKRTEDETGLPTVDPVREGSERIVNSLKL
jgi:uncharacterized NAD-dependent epimerase/dehydratase family protein